MEGKATDKGFLTYLEQFISDHKKQLFDSVLQERTKKITVVLEDIFQPQNASSAVRTCDCFGIQDMHIIENQYRYELNPRVVLGASKWVHMNYYNALEHNTEACLTKLKSEGFKILATSPKENCLSIEEVDLSCKNAFVFGTELTGITEVAEQMADATVKIPMVGFTESFNISASVAISMYALSSRLKKETNNWMLTEKEQDEIRLHWYKSAVKNADIHEKEYLKSNFFDNL